MRFVSRFRRLARPSSRMVSTSVLALVVIAFASPANGATTTLVGRMALAVRLSPGLAATSGPQGTSFAGTPAVGALFNVSNGKLGSHFCTASVVHSAGGDLLITGTTVNDPWGVTIDQLTGKKRVGEDITTTLDPKVQQAAIRPAAQPRVGQ